jgi:hypothetical protein
MDTTRDKHGREIMVGDVLKVFHFAGARRKQYFMYKQVIGTRLLGGHSGSDKVEFLEVSHLNMDHKENYYLGRSEGAKANYEILQGLDDIEARPKL